MGQSLASAPARRPGASPGAVNGVNGIQPEATEQNDCTASRERAPEAEEEAACGQAAAPLKRWLSAPQRSLDPQVAPASEDLRLTAGFES